MELWFLNKKTNAFRTSVMRLNQVTLPCSDLPKTIAFYKTLGLRQIVGNDHYARFELPEGESTLSIEVVDDDKAGPAGIYFECAFLDKTVEQLKKAGIQFESDPKDQPWLWREAWLKDPFGNRLCLFNAGSNRKNPPWRLQ